MKAIIVEDSRLARKELAGLLKEFEEIKLEGEASNAEEAFELLNRNEIDLIFLDINMPGKNGFELLEMLEEIPLVIFTTAYDEYAIKSFEYNALDYLLKPVKKEALERALNKARRMAPKTAKEETGLPKRIFIKEGEKCWLINTDEITAFESEGNYTRVYYQGGKPLIYKSLNQIEEKADSSIFFRASRTHIINLNYIKSVKPGLGNTLKLTLSNGMEVTVSRRNAQKLKSLLSF